MYEQNRRIARSLFKGFVEAQRMAYADLRKTAGLKIMLPWLIQNLPETERVMGKDFWSYGLWPNVDNVSKLLAYHHQQGLSERLLTPQEIFAPETVDSSFKI